MSGPNPPGSEGPDLPGQEPGDQPTSDRSAAPDTGETEFYSHAYSAPESEQFISGPYVPADSSLYDYDSYEPATELVDQEKPPRWPWIVGVAAIVAAVAGRDHHDDPATAASATAAYRGAATTTTTGDRDGDAGAATWAAARHGRGPAAATGH